MRISIIIPCYNEEKTIGRSLSSLGLEDNDIEVIVVDGGSTDCTAEVVGKCSNVQWVKSDRSGRACQMNLGARMASGGVLLFLHADTQLPLNYVEQILEVMADDRNSGGSFRLSFDSRHFLLRCVEYLTWLNLKWFTFGDHAMFFRTETFRELNGYEDMPILEDLEFQLRARRYGRMPRITAPVLTSARRFVDNGVVTQLLIDSLILAGYALGVSPFRLVKMYPRQG